MTGECVAPAGDGRWVEVSPSQFTHETEGLDLVRKLLPGQPPFRAWSNFEFRDGRGRWHEVDLLVSAVDGSTSSSSSRTFGIHLRQRQE